MNKKTPENKFVADARARTGLLQKEFAPLIGTSEDNLSQYESGRRQPSPRILEQIRRVLIERGLADEPQSPLETKILQMFRQISNADQNHIAAILNTMSKVSTKRKRPD